MNQRKKEEGEKGILERGKDFVREKGKGIHLEIKKDPEIPTDNPLK